MPSLSSPLRDVIGDKAAKVLAKHLDLHTAGDLLRHYPRRYAERGVLTGLNELRVDDYVTVVAELAKVDVVPMRQRRGQMVKVVVTDGSGKLTLTFFNQAWRARQLAAGMRGLFAGKVGVFRGQRQLTNPQTQLLEDDDPGETSLLTGLIPVYPATAAMPSWNIAKAVRVAIDVVDLADDPLPLEVRERHGLLPIDEALRLVHQP